MSLEFTFKDGYRSDSDNWSQSGSRISETNILDRLRRAFADRKTLVLEHKFYRGARSPEFLVFDDFDFICEYLQEKCRAGDSIWIFDITDTLKVGKELVQGKCPNNQGEIPQKGAY